jgi:hypothetical protein
MKYNRKHKNTCVLVWVRLHRQQLHAAVRSWAAYGWSLAAPVICIRSTCIRSEVNQSFKTSRVRLHADVHQPNRWQMFTVVSHGRIIGQLSLINLSLIYVISFITRLYLALAIYIQISKCHTQTKL